MNTLGWTLLFFADAVMLRFLGVCDGSKWIIATLALVALTGAALGMARELKRWGWL